MRLSVVCILMVMSALGAGFDEDRGRWVEPPAEFADAVPEEFSEEQPLTRGNYLAICALGDAAVQHRFYSAPTTNGASPEKIYYMTNAAALNLDANTFDTFWRTVYDAFRHSDVRRGNGVTVYPNAVGDSIDLYDIGWTDVGDLANNDFRLNYFSMLQTGWLGLYGESASFALLEDILSSLRSVGVPFGDYRADDFEYFRDVNFSFYRDYIKDFPHVYPEIRSGDRLRSDVMLCANHGMKRFDTTPAKIDVGQFCFSNLVTCSVVKGVLSQSDLAGHAAGLVYSGLFNAMYFWGGLDERSEVVPNLEHGEKLECGFRAGKEESWECRYKSKSAKLGAIVTVKPVEGGQMLSEWIHDRSFRVTEPVPGIVNVYNMIVASDNGFEILDVEGVAPSEGFEESYSNVWISCAGWLERNMDAFATDWPQAPDGIKSGCQTYLTMGRDDSSMDFMDDNPFYSTFCMARSIRHSKSDRHEISNAFLDGVELGIQHEPKADFLPIELRAHVPNINAPHATMHWKWELIPDGEYEFPIVGFGKFPDGEKPDNEDDWNGHGWDDYEEEDDPTEVGISESQFFVNVYMTPGEVDPALPGRLKNLSAYDRKKFVNPTMFKFQNWNWMHY